MSNYAWVLEVRPGYEEEYKKRHDELWPEMKDMLREVFEITIYLGMD